MSTPLPITRHSPMPEFTNHNVRLADGRLTRPGDSTLLHERPWFSSARRMLERLFPYGFGGLRLVDLGCLEGGMTLEFARMGFDALGIEVRESNFACCRYLQEHGDAPAGRLRFVRDDVWNLEKYGAFDVVFCCGLFYHLDEPRRFLDILARTTKRVLVLNTHFATETPCPAFLLSEPADQEGWRGRWYVEHEEEDLAHIDNLRWHSWHNQCSFWPMRPDLLQGMHDAGFPVVLEQYDFLAPDIRQGMADGIYGSKCRGVFWGLR